MKKNVIRSSMFAVAALSLMLGGTAAPTSVKEQVSETPAIISKAIENSGVTDELYKGTPVNQLAQASTESTEDTEEFIETAAEVDVAEQADETVVVQAEAAPTTELKVKPAKVESDQVVANIESYLNIREGASEDSAVIGKFYNGNVGTIVEAGEEWSLVASGNAYGYVKNEYLLFGTEAENYIANNCDQVARVTAETLNIRAEESTDSDIVSLTDQGTALTVLGQDNGWYKVAVTDDQTGYVSSDYVYIDYVYETAVTIEEEQAAEAARAAEIAAQEQAAAAQEQAAAAQQTAVEQPVSQVTTEAPATTQQVTTEAPKTEATTEAPKTEATTEEKKEEVTQTEVVVTNETTSTETVKQESSGTSGQAVADYAVQFVGNPYKYGGTSLTDGADCSGFVQSVYAHFGYSLSRTAASQAGDGTTVSLDSLQPGDLIFYHGYGHVAIYIGGGQVVHASTPETGIKISSYDYSSIDKAVRIIK